MKASELKSLLSGDLELDVFLIQINRELRAYNQDRNVKGGVLPVEFYEDVELSISDTDLAKLCQLFIDGRISKETLEYIGDAIELSESVALESNIGRELVFDFSNPVINGVFTKEKANEFILALKA